MMATLLSDEMPPPSPSISRPYGSGLPSAARMIARCAASSQNAELVEIALAAEDYVREKKRLVANVDFYAAAVLFYLGFPLNLFTGFVASSRIVGWSAHALEQYANNRIIRPRARYSGDREQPFVPLEQR